MGLAVGFIVADVTGVGDVEATGLGEGDVAAQRKDVKRTFLLQH